MNKYRENAYLTDLDLDDLQGLMKALGEPKFRALQVWEGIYKQLAGSPQEITNIPKDLRKKLSAQFEFSSLKPIVSLDSSDGQTTKTLFELTDGTKIETVLMNYDKRHTHCISSQVGCAMNCSFCATGQMGFTRNLTAGEIVEQVLYFARQLAKEDLRVTNIVFMGMGEPFHNYDAVMKAIRILNDEKGFKLGARRFTVSTVGLIPGIKRFTAENSQVNLAISLHSTDETRRSSIMPVNNRYPISDLVQVCREYFDATGRRVTFEWALIDGVNDTIQEAEALADLLEGLTCHVNVIPLNPTGGYSGKKSTKENVEAFKNTLESRGIACTVRIRRGIDIQAGCGQLASKHN
ncbi:MAG: 23S rRNA (adenine(2503)-C(2))-methyltransferase RlmN [Anaerolineales bacterium]